jgi:hypothetical protein
MVSAACLLSLVLRCCLLLLVVHCCAVWHQLRLAATVVAAVGWGALLLLLL